MHSKNGDSKGSWVTATPALKGRGRETETVASQDVRVCSTLGTEFLLSEGKNNSRSRGLLLVRGEREESSKNGPELGGSGYADAIGPESVLKLS